MTALGIIGIIIGVATLIYGAYNGISTIILAPLCVLLIALFNGMNLLTTFSETMLPATCNYVTAMLGPVLCGCVIAALYNKSGAALSIANALYDLFTIKARRQAAAGETVVMRPILAIITIYVIGTVLAYSGMNPVVLMFILFPISMDLFAKARISRAMGPGVVLGALATSACSMPGTTSPYQNKYEFLRNPIIADFLGMEENREYLESELEKNIIANLEKFMMELGNGFAFVERQQRIHTDKEDYYIDLVFYNFSLSEDEDIEKVDSLLKYFKNNKDGLLPYQERKTSLSTSPEGIVYRNMGTMENHIWSVIARRMKHKHTCWSIRGGNHLAKILTKKCSGRIDDVTSKLKAPEFEGTKACEIQRKILKCGQVSKKIGKSYNIRLLQVYLIDKFANVYFTVSMHRNLYMFVV